MEATDMNKKSVTAEVSDISLSLSDLEIWEATQRATEEYGICPNRLWAPASSHPWKEKIIPYLMQFRPGEPVKGHDNHAECNYDVCRFSRLDFTEIPQRHELKSCTDDPCERLCDQFPMDLLEEATKAGKIAAWKLDGKAPIEHHQPYMAISHVWSDGTGVGYYSQGEVNRCLYNYFKGIAERFQCEGIWWDTICLPTDEAIHRIAMDRMQTNYEGARITLVHDCYLRDCEWFDAESACIAIIMSPWFSRGWTALELAHSHRVKVIFKDSIIKDLDEDILANPRSIRHKIASEIISSLRQKTITTINDLLQILNSRYTSWPEDMAVVSALLTGIKMDPDASEQNIYQGILKKIGKLSHDNLFHRSSTMSGSFCWCPANLLEMQTSTAKSALRVFEDGSIFGPWKVIHGLRKVPSTMYNWAGINPGMQMRLQSALYDPDKHLLLAEPTTTDGSRSNFREKSTPITRALLVKPIGSNAFFSLGPVYFNPPLKVYGKSENTTYVTIGQAAVSEKTSEKTSDIYLKYPSNRYRTYRERLRTKLSPLVHKIACTEQLREKSRERQDSCFRVGPILERLRSLGARLL